MALRPNLEALELEVAEARARLAATLDRLASPKTSEALKRELMKEAQDLRNEAMHYAQKTKHEILNRARETGREKVHSFTDDLKQKARDNPLAVLLIGAGIAWRLYERPPVATVLVGAGLANLMWSGASRHTDRSAYRDPYRKIQPRGYAPGGVAGYGYPVEAEPPDSSMAERMSAKASAASEMVRDAGERTREMASEVAVQASDLAERAGSVGSDLVERTRRDPLMAGIVAAVGGVALAYAFRSTPAGDRFIGQARDVIGRGAHQTASGASRAGRRLADRAGDMASSARHMTERTSGVADRMVDRVVHAIRGHRDTESGPGSYVRGDFGRDYDQHGYVPGGIAGQGYGGGRDRSGYDPRDYGRAGYDPQGGRLMSGQGGGTGYGDEDYFERSGAYRDRSRVGMNPYDPDYSDRSSLRGGSAGGDERSHGRGYGDSRGGYDQGHAGYTEPGPHRGRGPKNYTRSDERIRQDVNDRLVDDRHLDASEIEASVSGGEVTLNGTVASRFEKRHAEDIAEFVSGVRHVQNNLRINRQESGYGASDHGASERAANQRQPEVDG